VEGTQYLEVVQKLVRLDSENTIEILSTFHRLRQVASGYLPFSDRQDSKHILHFKNNAKLEWLTELVALDPDVQIVIFHEYTHTGEMICRTLTKHKKTYGWLYGGVPNLATANKIVADFQQGHSQYLVANAAKGGMSINLPTCDYLIFFECPVSVITRLQAAARPMARGKRPLLIDDLVASPVDRQILKYQREGRDLMKALKTVRRSLAR
jgi:SNF2 family DNA or RNA helicase